MLFKWTMFGLYCILWCYRVATTREDGGGQGGRRAGRFCNDYLTCVLRSGILAAMISKLDESVGQIVEALQTKQMLKDSIIVFMSDNGAPSVNNGTPSSRSFPNWGSNYPLRGVCQCFRLVSVTQARLFHILYNACTSDAWLFTTNCVIKEPSWDPYPTYAIVATSQPGGCKTTWKQTGS